jgi:hypothetical protein
MMMSYEFLYNDFSFSFNFIYFHFIQGDWIDDVTIGLRGGPLAWFVLSHPTDDRVLLHHGQHYGGDHASGASDTGSCGVAA